MDPHFAQNPRGSSHRRFVIDGVKNPSIMYKPDPKSGKLPANSNLFFDAYDVSFCGYIASPARAIQYI